MPTDFIQLIQAVRRLYKTPGQHLTLSQVVELNKRFVEGYAHFKDEPRVKELRKGVLEYNRLVRDLGLRDHQVCISYFVKFFTSLTLFRRFLERRKLAARCLVYSHIASGFFSFGLYLHFPVSF